MSYKINVGCQYIQERVNDEHNVWSYILLQLPLSDFLFFLFSWSYGVLLWEIESGGMLSFRDVFIPSFVYTFVLSSSYVEFYFSFFISRCLVTLNYLPRVQFYAHSMLLLLCSTIIIIIIIIIIVIDERKAIPVAVTSITFL